MVSLVLILCAGAALQFVSEINTHVLISCEIRQADGAVAAHKWGMEQVAADDSAIQTSEAEESSFSPYPAIRHG